VPERKVEGLCVAKAQRLAGPPFDDPPLFVHGAAHDHAAIGCRIHAGYRAGAGAV